MKNFLPQNYWLDTLVPWACWRFESLVYFPHNKCCSTLYDMLFAKLNWTATTTQEIDWQSDFVFSHLRAPLKKHYKGIVEGLLKFPDLADFFLETSTDNIKFLSYLNNIDPHSYTIQRFLGNNSEKVYWIPVDTELDHKSKVFEILDSHGYSVPQEIKLWFMSLGVVYPATEKAQRLYDRLINLPTRPEVLRYLDFDQCLYDFITKPKGFEPKSYKARIDDLKSQGYSQLAAEEIADKEVADNRFTSWEY